MLKTELQKYGSHCGLSKRLQAKSAIIIEVLQECSSGLNKSKHNQLIEFMKLKLIDPENLRIQNKINYALKKWSDKDISKMIKFIGTYFHLLNQAELDEIIAINAERDRISNYNNPKADSIAFAIKYLHENSIDYKRALEIIKSIHINPTFTAHPTETKRNSLIDKQRRVLSLVEKLLDKNINQKEDQAIRLEVLRLCKLILGTDDVRSRRVSINEEIENVIKNTINSLWHAVPLLAEDMESAFFHFYGKKIDIHEFLSFQTWVGGDRDGNPNVTFKISEYAVVSLIKHLIFMYNEDIDLLFNDYSISLRQPKKDCPLHNSIETDLKKSNISKEVIDRYEFEPIRLKLLLIKEKLKEYEQSINQRKNIKFTVEDFQIDLTLIKDFLKNYTGDELLANGDIQKLITRVKIFGLHFMSLDIRQHSSVHENAVEEIISSISPKFSYIKAGESERCEILKKLILTDIIELDFDSNNLSNQLKEVLDTFLFIKNSIILNKRIISSYIISMTDSKSDILEVVFLSKITGIVKFKNKKISSKLKIVPLYETISDLKNAPKLLEELINDDLYNSIICNHSNFQEVMFGYSDSNKDGGFGMANYSLNQCLNQVGEIFRHHKINFRIFHGRGGSISRGGGKSNKAILSLPPVSHNGKIRFTEQGEVINYRYGSYQIAKRHLEQITCAQIISLSIPGKKSENKNIIKKIMKESHLHYKKNILSKKCWNFFLNATPINYISKIPITSRPASRSKIKSENIAFKDLRAIPWVFSWTQLRYNISGWFGMGHALNIIHNDTKNLNEIKSLSKSSKFFSQLLDNMSFEMARMRLNVSRLYAKSDKEKDFIKLIENDYNLAVGAYKKITGYNFLLERNKVISASIDYRNPFTDLLNYAQIELLKRNQDFEKQTQESDAIIFSSINHLAAAMQTSG